ncbi:MAG: pantoate--beta-alanine ligase [Sphingobacteriaceae bacterium]|nr:pantoate--beta-alanine ligase [Cytophagaceae bacterium]
MQLFSTILELKKYRLAARSAGHSLGLVPTMGALHEGHLSLIAASRAANDRTVCSIFVNPIQFNNPDDLARYPRTLEADAAILEAAGCDAVFAPSSAEIYPQPPALKFDFGALETVMEGRSRPGHFNGVGVVVAKLFHLVQPDRAYFGQKDLQQCAVVRRLIDDLSFPLDLVVCPTQREADGLAMSSRNRNLSAEERANAPFLFAELTKASALLTEGQATEAVKMGIETDFAQNPAFRLDYFEVADPATLLPLSGPLGGRPAALCVAAFLGVTRLIDNVVLEPPRRAAGEGHA